MRDCPVCLNYGMAECMVHGNGTLRMGDLPRNHAIRIENKKLRNALTDLVHDPHSEDAQRAAVTLLAEINGKALELDAKNNLRLF